MLKIFYIEEKCPHCGGDKCITYKGLFYATLPKKYEAFCESCNKKFTQQGHPFNYTVEKND